MPTLVGDYVDINSAIREEQALPPGLYEARFYLAEPVSSQDIADTRAYLKSEGVDVKKVYQRKTDGLYYLGVQYVRHPVGEAIAFLPLAVIPLIGFALVAALVGVGIFKLDTIANNIGKILLITFGGTIVLAALLRKPIEKAVERF
jgi:hypothetical protein